MTQLPENPNLELIRIESLSGILLNDRRRVRVTLVLSSTDIKSTVELVLLDQNKNEITRSMIIGCVDEHITFTLHLGDFPAGTPLFVGATIQTEGEVVLDTKVSPVDVPS
jgi:hypothetical protein